MIRLSVALAAAGALLAPGDGASRPSLAVKPPAPRAVTAVATDYHLALPATLPAGPTTFRLTNRGHELHHLMLVRLEAGKTAADLVAAMKASGGPLPPWALGVGGPNGVDPGATSLPTTVRLLPGHYVALCMIPSPGGPPHFIKGMVSDLDVTPGRLAAAVAFDRRPDATVTLDDYGFATSRPIGTGTHHIVVQNGSAQWHELQLAQLAPGKTAAELIAWTDKPSGPPPAHFLGGVSPLGPGQQAELDLSLAPGHYAMLCFLPDVKDGKPHFMHGMIHEFDVK